MSQPFLTGAVIGSFIFIMAGRGAAQRLLDAVQARVSRSRRR